MCRLAPNASREMETGAALDPPKQRRPGNTPPVSREALSHIGNDWGRVTNMVEAPYRDTARDYWAAGWRGILPLPPRAKTPPPKGFTGETGLWPSNADIQAWIDGGEGEGNICLRLPQHVIGIDVDEYDDKHGADTLARREIDWGTLPPTWISSARGGTESWVSGIRFYRVPEGLAWPGEIGTDTELIQYKHRYAVVWPSTNPRTATQYRWYPPDGDPHVLLPHVTIPHVDQFAPLPADWVSGLTAGIAATDTPRNTLSAPAASAWLNGRNDPHGQGCPRVLAATARAVGDLRFGSRHAAARDATLRLIRLADDGHTGVAVALGQVQDAFFAACADTTRGTVRPIGEADREFMTMLLGAINLVTADPHGERVPGDPCTFLADLMPTPKPAQIHESSLHAIGESGPEPVIMGPDGTVDWKATNAAYPELAGPGATPNSAAPIVQALIDNPLLAQEIATQRLRRLAKRTLDEEEAAAAFREPVWRPSLTAELAMPNEPVIYTVDEVMPTGANVVLTAQYKSGKTTMVNHLTKCLADEEPFLGKYKVTTLTGRVAIFNYEVDDRQYRRWLREVDIDNTDRVVVLNLRGHRLPFTTPAVEDWLVRWLATNEVALWIIDPFARAFLGSGDNENDNTQVGEFLDAIDVVKSRAGVSDLVMPVHTGRAEMEQGKERARGATRLDDWADVRWLLTTNDDARYFRATGRDVDVAEARIDYVGASRGLIARDHSSRRDDRAGVVSQAILDLVERNPGISYRNLRDGVRDYIGHIDTREVDDVRETLIRHGRIRYESPKQNGQKGAHYPADVGDLIAGTE